MRAASELRDIPRGDRVTSVPCYELVEVFVTGDLRRKASFVEPAKQILGSLCGSFPMGIIYLTNLTGGVSILPLSYSSHERPDFPPSVYQ